MTITPAYTEHLSETWLLERTYHAQLWSGKELSVSDLTLAMKQLNDFEVPLALQSSKSTLAERLPLSKSTNFCVPLSAWREISQEEASATSQQGIPVLLYGEHTWKHAQGASGTWSANKNMRVIISGNAGEQPEAVSGTDYAVCYIDQQRGTFSNTVWKAWFVSDTATILKGSDQIRHDLRRQHDARLHGRAHDMLGFRRANIFFRQRRHFAERDREVKRGVIDRAEIGVGTRRLGRFVRHDREIDLLGLSHS